MNHPRIRFLIPYFGKWPFWMPLFLESCRRNPDIDWLFFSDCGMPDRLPENVQIDAIDYSDYLDLVSRRLEIDFVPENPYKLCDIKPALGYIHKDRIGDCDFWAFGDIDVVYGRLREYFADARLSRYDLISCHARRISGHLCLIRNIPRMREAFMRIPNWRKRFSDSRHHALDEGAFSRIFIRHKNFPKPLFELVNLLNPWRRRSDFQEAYSTPNGRVAWIDGSYNFPRRWFWREGRLSNDLDGGREFPYLHFLVWKKNEWRALPVSLTESLYELAGQPGWGIGAEGLDALP
jgi:hypothetical protein